MPPSPLASLGGPADGAQSDEDEDSPAEGTRRCDSLRISYRGPGAKGRQLTEEVFLDPRDAWRGDGFDAPVDKATGGNLLLVSAAAVTALQQQNDRQAQYTASTQGAIDACRRDYLKEQKRLIAELDLLAKRVPKSAEADLKELKQMAWEMAEQAAAGAEAVVAREDALAIVKSFGPKVPADEDAVKILKAAGFDGVDPLTFALLLKRVLASQEGLMEERERLRALLLTLETNATRDNLFDGMIASARGDGTTITELIMALIELTPAEAERQKIEDRCTNGVRPLYEKLVKRLQEIEPVVAQWRGTLQLQSELAEQAQTLHMDLKVAEDRLAFKESKEREQLEEWERRRRARHEAREERRQAKLRLKEERAAAEDPDAFIDIYKYISVEERDLLKKEELAYGAQLRRHDVLNERIQQLHSELQAVQQAKEEVTIRRDHARDSVEALEVNVDLAEQRVREDEVAEAQAEHRLKEIKLVRIDLEDRYKLATLPPPKEKDFSQLEREVEEAKRRNQELRSEESQLWDRVRLYESRWDHAEAALQNREAEEAAAESRARQAAEEAAAAAKRNLPSRQSRHADPLLLEYHERVALPEYSKLQRHLALHTDERARERRLQQRHKEAADAEAARILPALRNIEDWSPPPPPGSHVPVGFRRPEDLRVRRSVAERSLERAEASLQGAGSRFLQLAEELRGLGQHVGQEASEAARLHTEVADRLRVALADESLPDSQARFELERALEGHQVATSRAEEAWHLAEMGCVRGASEAELATEGAACTAREEELTAAVQSLYSTAAQTARSGPPQLVAPSRQCVADWDAVEPKLVAARLACGDAWPEALRAAAGLARERAAQDELQAFLRVEEKRKTLLDAEISAPPEARRALAAMRSATTMPAACGSPVPARR